VIKVLEEWRLELEGSSQQSDIIMDYKNLQTFVMTKHLSPHHIWWLEVLLRFNFRIVYSLGSANVRVDALSSKLEHIP
jgi:hypothetical protein